MKNANRKFEYPLFLLILFLTVFGLVNMFSASTVYSLRVFNDASYLLVRQIFFIAIGLVLCIITSFVNDKLIDKVSFVIYLSTAILVFVTVFIGTMSRGSVRWFTFRGLTFQPSEIMKLSTILYLSSFIKKHFYELDENYNMYKLFLIGFLPAAVVSINNLSTGIIIMTITILMIFVVSNKKLIYIVAAALIIFIYVFAYQMALIVENVGLLKSYQLNRIFAWKNPLEYQDLSYQTLQGLYAIASGGIFGRGFGESIQKTIMPEAQNDMVFTIICEELGFFGAMILMILYLLIIIRIFYIAYQQKSIFKFMICYGIGVHISLQIILNLCVVMNLVPNTGIILPFVSYGGTSLIILYIEIGLVMNCSRKIE